MFAAASVDAVLTEAPATWGYVDHCLSRPAGSSASSPSRTPAIPTDMAPSKVSATPRVPIPITKGAVNKHWRSNGVPAAQREKAAKMVLDANAREAEYNAAVTAHLTAVAVGGSQQAKQEPTFTKVHPGERRMMFKAPALTQSPVSSADFAKRQGAVPRATRLFAAVLTALYAAHAMGATSHVITAWCLLLSLPGGIVQWPHRDYANNGFAAWRRSLSCMLTVSNPSPSVFHFYDKRSGWTTVCVMCA